VVSVDVNVNKRGTCDHRVDERVIDACGVELLCSPCECSKTSELLSLPNSDRNAPRRRFANSCLLGLLSWALILVA